MQDASANGTSKPKEVGFIGDLWSKRRAHDHALQRRPQLPRIRWLTRSLPAAPSSGDNRIELDSPMAPTRVRYAFNELRVGSARMREGCAFAPTSHAPTGKYNCRRLPSNSGRHIHRPLRRASPSRRLWPSRMKGFERVTKGAPKRRGASRWQRPPCRNPPAARWVDSLAASSSPEAPARGSAL